MNWFDYAHKNLFKLKHYARGLHDWMRPEIFNGREIKRLQARADRLSNEEKDQIQQRAQYYNQLDSRVTVCNGMPIDHSTSLAFQADPRMTRLKLTGLRRHRL